MIERAHQILKLQLKKQKRGNLLTPAQKLSKALFTLNYLNILNSGLTAAQMHHSKLKELPRPLVLYKGHEDCLWKGLVELITWGRGYACVLSPTGPLWLPVKRVKLWVHHEPGDAACSSKEEDEDPRDPRESLGQSSPN